MVCLAQGRRRGLTYGSLILLVHLWQPWLQHEIENCFLLQELKQTKVLYVPATSLPCTRVFDRTRGVRTRCSACGGVSTSWHLCGPIPRSSNLPFLLGFLCSSLVSGSDPVLGQVRVVRAQSTVIDAVLQEEASATVLRVVQIEKNLCCSEELEMPSIIRYLLNTNFSTRESNFYHLVGCS